MVQSVTSSSILLGLAIAAANMGGIADAFAPAGTGFTSTFSTQSASALMMGYKNNDDNEVDPARKEFLATLGFTAAGWAFSGFVHWANAAEEGDMMSAATTVEETPMIQSSNLRSLKRAEKQLSKLEFYAVQNDYEALKTALRNAPFSEIRKNSFALIKEYAGQEEAQSKLTASYESFIASLEKMDSTASLGMRGRKLDNSALLQSFQATSVALNDWIAVATAVAAGSS